MEKAVESGLGLTLPAGRPPQERFSWGFHRPRRRFAEHSRGCASRESKNKQKKDVIESRSIDDCAAAAAQGLEAGRTEAPLPQSAFAKNLLNRDGLELICH